MTTAEANERLIRDLKAVVNDAEELMKATAGQAGEAVGRVRARLGAALESAKENFGDLGEQASGTLKATDRCIRDHPYETVGVAFGVGLLIGLLARGK